MKAIIKVCTIYMLRLLMHILYIFPVKNNRIVINAYRGSQYSCNPKYISEYLTRHYPGKFEIIWAFHNPDQFRYLEEQGIRLVKYNSIKRFCLEATCKVSINNIGSYSWFPVRKGQEHMNTWHGGFNIKKVGLDEPANSLLMKKTIQMSSDLTTILLSTSRIYDENIAVRDLGYRKPTFPCGYPRNDIIFRQKRGEIDLRPKVCRFLNIEEDSYIVLYVPTYRYDAGKELPHPDYKGIKNILTEQGKNKPVIVTRMHHLMKADMGDPELTYDATSYPDMQELLAVADCCITDYSSCIWDYAIMQKPVYLYVPDFEEYKKERGYHVDIYELGFPVAVNNEELLNAFARMSEDKGQAVAEKFIDVCGSYEKGNACEQICKFIYHTCFGGRY